MGFCNIKSNSMAAEHFKSARTGSGYALMNLLARTKTKVGKKIIVNIIVLCDFGITARSETYVKK